MDGEFEPLRREPAYLKVCRAIEDRIVSGALGEGASLPTESELCAQFAVTRSTVREGLRLLEQTGLITRGPGKRLFVSRPHTEKIAKETSRGLSLSGATFHEAWECLNVVYPMAGRFAATRLDPEALDALAAVQAELAATPDRDEARVVALTARFFGIVAESVNNRVMTAMLQSVNLMIETGLARVIEKAPRARVRIAEAQGEILAAFRERDADRAALWLRRHIDDLRRGYEIAGLDPGAPVF